MKGTAWFTKRWRWGDWWPLAFVEVAWLVWPRDWTTMKIYAGLYVALVAGRMIER